MMKEVFEKMLKRNEIEKELLESLIKELQKPCKSKDCCLAYMNGCLEATNDNIKFYKKQLEGVENGIQQ